jgi:hypothetical protein
MSRVRFQFQRGSQGLEDGGENTVIGDMLLVEWY